VGSLASLILIVERTVAPAYPWYPMMTPEAERVMVLSDGGGTVPFRMMRISSHLEILVISDTRTLSRADRAYEKNDMRAMVQRMTRMVMTTMSSVRVKAETPLIPLIRGKLLLLP